MDEIKKERKQAKLKCSMCGEKFDRELLTIKSNKKYCENCLKIHNEKIKENKSDWELLFEYICSLYNIERPTGMMFKQLKDFRGEDYNYTHIGMYYTLKYYYEILENKVLENTGLGIIPYYYDRARRHYNKLFDIQDIVEQFEDNEKDIKIKAKIYNKKINRAKPLPLISWEEINDEED